MVIGVRPAARAAPAHRADPPVGGADLAPVHLRHLHRHHRLHGHRDDLEHGRGGGQPRPRRAARHQHGARRRARRVHRHVAGGAVGHAGGQQRAAAWTRGRGYVVPGRGQAGQDRGHLRARQRPVADRVPAVESRRSTDVHAARRDEAHGRGLQRETARSTRSCTARSWAATSSKTRCRAWCDSFPTAWPGCAAILAVWVGILAATILVIATNAGLIGVSRLAYSLGQHRQVPPILGRVHPKRLTPYVSIIVFGVVACLIILPGSTVLPRRPLRLRRDDLVHGGARLRGRRCASRSPTCERPLRTPFNIRVRGKSLPVLSVIGGLGTFTVWCVVVATHAEGRLIGFTWMGVGPRHLRGVPQGQGLLADEDRREGRRARVHAGGHRLPPDPRAHRRLADHRRDDGARLPARDREEVVHRRPLRDRGAAQPAARRPAGQRARQGGEGARRPRPHRRAVQGDVHAARRDGARRPAGRSSRRPSTAAPRSSSSAPVRKRRIGDLVFGRTTDYVLDHAPCEVLLNLVPKDYPTEGSAVLDERTAGLRAQASRRPPGGRQGPPATK